MDSWISRDERAHTYTDKWKQEQALLEKKLFFFALDSRFANKMTLHTYCLCFTRTFDMAVGWKRSRFDYYYCILFFALSPACHAFDKFGEERVPTIEKKLSTPSKKMANSNDIFVWLITCT